MAEPVADIPLPPDDRPCSGGCGAAIKPEWFLAVDFGSFRTPGRWAFADPCEACQARETREAEERDAQAEAAKKAEKLAALLGGPRAAEEFTFETFSPGTESQKALLSALRRFESANDNLYVWGKCGVGKSHLASAVAATAFSAGLKTEFWKPPRLLRLLRGKEAWEQDKIIEKLAAADVFVLDDLGVGAATEFAISVFYEVVDARFLGRRNGLVVTSNLSLDDLAEKTGDDRLASRLSGMCRTLHVEGPDARAGERL